MMSMLFALCSFITAQTAYEKSKVLDNVSISVVGGATTPLDFNSVCPLNGVAGLKIQKDFTPVVGLNVEGLASFGDNHFGNAKTVVKCINTSVNGVLNLSNLLCDYKGSPRKFEVSTEVGLGWLHSWTGHTNALTSKTGLVASFNLSDAHSIIVNPTVYWNLSKDGPIQFNKNNAQLGLLVGYTYHFITSNGTHSFKAYNIGAMNKEINNLRAELAKKPTEVVVTKEVVKTEVVTNTLGNVVVFFAQNSAELTGTAMAELAKIPSGSKVSIIGAASPEGTTEYNQKLSEKRAENVANYLKSNDVVVENCVGVGVTDNTSGRIATITIK